MFDKQKTIAVLKDKYTILAFCGVVFCWFWFSFDLKFFNIPTSTVLIDRKGELMGAKIASDGQWRFPRNPDFPVMFEQAITEFEDRHFYHHPGFNPLAFGRAIIQNIKARKIVSGGSTISMQVIRMYRGNKKRTLFEKTIEILMAMRMESYLSKKEILALYASIAPFGGNVVGLDAASWRYYGRSPNELSVSEMATLAVLPNAPGLIYPGKNHIKLKQKRNRLLDRLYEQAYIDKVTCELAKQEALPEKPKPLPNYAPHYLELLHKQKLFRGTLIKSGIDKTIQLKVIEILEKHHDKLKENEIHNGAIIIMDPINRKPYAYVGNTHSDNNEHGNEVNILDAKRSPGSTLKPFLYALMLSDGQLLPEMLFPDIPTQISGYKPQNFTLSYDGAVPAKNALSRSLNVPAVKMLQSYGVEKFHFNLKRLGHSFINKPSSHYGLSLILGGAEATLWELVDTYSDMVRVLEKHYFYDKPHYKSLRHYPLNASSIYLTFEAMNEVARPDEEQNWELFSSNSKIAWKTGTSYGNRDAWAIGATPQYVVGVWVGNASGEGRPGITGIGAAAPVLLEVFNYLKPTKWFSKPYDEMEKVAICKQSGYRASSICEPVDTMWIQNAGLKTPPCPFHSLVHLDLKERYRVNSDCEDPSQMITKSWFILPPSMEWFYKSKNPSYKTLPPFSPKCKQDETIRSMDIIYPKNPVAIYIPLEIDGSPGKTVFEAAHRFPKSTIHWHLDDNFIGSTQNFHKMALKPAPGKHTLTLVDENGETITQYFEIIDKKSK